MIENKVLKFGYGTMSIGGDSFTRTLKIFYIKPPGIVGEPINNKDVQIIDSIYFQYDVLSGDMKSFLKELHCVTPENPFVQFRGYTFDFTNFNSKSIEVLIEYTQEVIRGWQNCLAC
ncbi:hypothetical protein [Bacillus toyonensis]|uniref:hypothetical protein n=1 Tax=Bacillus toyonensis TaxID=155322 RepID=UPI002E1AED55|nr:hypothetical protein [Bacillus toyonensis]